MPFPKQQDNPAGNRAAQRPVGFMSSASPKKTTPTKRVSMPARTAPPPVRSNSSGQYSASSVAGSSGGGAPRNPAPARQGKIQSPGRPVVAAKPKPQPTQAKKPVIPSLAKYLAGDDTFQGQQSALQKQLEDFINSNNAQQTDVKDDFSTAISRMGQERTKALADMQADFAARGLLNSGLYTDSVGKYDTDYNNKLADLGTDQQRSLDELLSGVGNFQTSVANQTQAAKQQAIRRRAEQYGIK